MCAWRNDTSWWCKVDSLQCKDAHLTFTLCWYEVQVTAADYILKTGVSNFRNTWDTLDPELECSDEYGLGARESLQEAIQAVSTILGMQPCEVRNVTQNFPSWGQWWWMSGERIWLCSFCSSKPLSSDSGTCHCFSNSDASGYKHHCTTITLAF